MSWHNYYALNVSVHKMLIKQIQYLPILRSVIFKERAPIEINYISNGKPPWQKYMTCETVSMQPHHSVAPHQSITPRHDMLKMS